MLPLGEFDQADVGGTLDCSEQARLRARDAQFMRFVA